MKGVQVAKEMEDVSEMQWKSYVDNLKKVGMLESALAVCDVSGSMTGDPMNVAIALSLLIAALSKPPFNGYIFYIYNFKTLAFNLKFFIITDWSALSLLRRSCTP